MQAYFKEQPIVGGGGGSQSQEVYSTEETVIGTWIDGKPLYRKVYTGVILAKDWTTITNNIPPIDFAIIHGSVFVTPSYYNMPVVSNNGKTFYALNIDDKNFAVYNDVPLFVGKKVWLIVEYTKTTDTVG